MRVRMRCNYGKLKRDRVYEVQEFTSGLDWLRISGLYVPLAYVEVEGA